MAGMLTGLEIDIFTYLSTVMPSSVKGSRDGMIANTCYRKKCNVVTLKVQTYFLDGM